jgi:hypothetical protein
MNEDDIVAARLAANLLESMWTCEHEISNDDRTAAGIAVSGPTGFPQIFNAQSSSADTPTLERRREMNAAVKDWLQERAASGKVAASTLQVAEHTGKIASKRHTVMAAWDNIAPQLTAQKGTVGRSYQRYDLEET